MKVTCQSCQAKYTIADEKVRGKVAKIRCKKCGSTVMVNAAGASESIPPPAASQSAPLSVDYTRQAPEEEQWSVLIADGDQRQLTPAQIDDLYKQGTVGYDTYVWKDGMADWQQIAQVEPLKSYLEGSRKPAIKPLTQEQPAWSAQTAAPRAESPHPAAARVEAGRRPGRGVSTDLFAANAADDLMTSAPANPAIHEPPPADKPTGARNENSVLFSLASLTAGRAGLMSGGGDAAREPAAGPDAPPPSRQADLSSLLSSGGNGAQRAAPKIDDIMNLGGGGIYNPGLASPALAPPPVEFPTGPSSSIDSTVGYPPKDNKRVVYAFGAGIVLVGAVALGMSYFGGDKTEASANKPSTTAAATAQTAAPAPTPVATPEPVAAVSAAPAAPTAIVPGAPPPKEEKPVAARTTTKAARQETAPTAAEAPPPKATATPVAATPAPAAGGGEGPSFDRAAAISALSAAASAAQACKRPDGPTGSGRIAVTFAPSGNATTANVEGPPFAGTSVGGCVAARFRGTRVPPFGGASVTVRKTFFIN